ncbi:MAG: ABC transporter permease [Actinomycetes bacterium]
MSSPILPTPLEEDIEAEGRFHGQQEPAQPEIAGRSLTQLAWSRLRRDRLAMVSLGFIIFITLCAVFAPLIVRVLGVGPNDYDQSAISDATAGLPTGWTDACTRGLAGFLPSCGGFSLHHPLGVEPQTGRDILAMLLYGSRTSLFIATTATILVVVLGLVFGTVAGYLGGFTDTVVGRFMDVLLAFPLLLMLIALTPVLTTRLEGWGFNTYWSRVVYMIVVFGFFGWPYLARIIRGQVISLREREFVESAVAMGSSSRRIIFKELIPNLWAPILVYATITLPSFIAFEAALSYLGVGVLPPTATWGKMLGDSVSYFSVMPSYLFIPGTMLFLVVLTFNVLGDAVRDALDPRAGRV